MNFSAFIYHISEMKSTARVFRKHHCKLGKYELKQNSLFGYFLGITGIGFLASSFGGFIMMVINLFNILSSGDGTLH